MPCMGECQPFDGQCMKPLLSAASSYSTFEPSWFELECMQVPLFEPVFISTQNTFQLLHLSLKALIDHPEGAFLQSVMTLSYTTFLR